MLTKNDLKAIKEIVGESNSVEIRPLVQKIGSLDTRLGSLEPKVDSLEKKVNSLEKTMKNGFRSLKKSSNEILSYLDRQHSNLAEQVDRIDRHLGLSSLN